MKGLSSSGSRKWGGSSGEPSHTWTKILNCGLRVCKDFLPNAIEAALRELSFSHPFDFPCWPLSATGFDPSSLAMRLFDNDLI
jgi:hypothetical protein